MSTDIELRWGYTLDDLQRVARGAAATMRAMAGDYDDRYGEAFAAAATALYGSEHWIPEHDLFRAARDALCLENRKLQQFRGCASLPDGTRGANGTGPNYVRYWRDITAPTPSPEVRIVERLALEQILPTLTRRQREVIGALAALDDHRAAWEALGFSKDLWAVHLSGARRRFLEAWHEGEVPSRPWGSDRRGGRSSLRSVMRQRAKAGRR